MTRPRIVAIVPMRHSSERVPGKNYRPIAGRPLYHHIVATLLACPMVSQVVIDTDSGFILEDASQHFPTVRLIERPFELRGGEVPMNTILLHDTSLVDADFYLQTHSTNPLLKPSTVGLAIEAFLGAWPERDSLFAVTPLQTRLWWGDGSAINHNPSELLRTQDLPPVFEENSNLYIFTRENLERRHNRIGERPLLFQMDRAEAWDIDEELDFTIARFLLEATQKVA